LKTGSWRAEAVTQEEAGKEEEAVIKQEEGIQEEASQQTWVQCDKCDKWRGLYLAPGDGR
jgi:hypothetical protein